ncbi:alpha-L-rhamnosidase [Flavihumibacter petaseus]|nr:alpha-L-rhamnosidase [Flavihumibacter petaseus]
MKKNIILFVILLAVMQLQAQPDLKVDALRVEGLQEPLGIDRGNPRFSWKITSAGRNVHQRSYRILVASSPDKLARKSGDIWDSGVVPADQSLDVLYAGKPLASFKKYYWTVEVKSNHGGAVWSRPATWSMGLRDPALWKASWIGINGHRKEDQVDSVFTRLSARYLRKEATLSKPVKRATAYIAGLGLYELYVNGKKAGNAVLAPTTAEYDKRVVYNAIDITAQLKQGRNALGVILGNGRYFMMRNYQGKPDPLTGIPQANYGYPCLLVQVQVEYTDGSTAQIVSDQQWKVTDNGPVIANSEYDGEDYDARKNLNGWAMPGYADQSWKTPDIMPTPAPVVEAQPNEPIVVKQKLTPVALHRTASGSWILDMGQNMVGWVAIRVKGKAGDTVTLRFSEKLKTKDSLYTDNLRNARATDNYVIGGNGWENWEPRFTYHGFRYVEVKGLQYVPDASQFTGKIVYDDIATTGWFSSSDSTMNAVFRNAYWTIRGNYRGMPTDCPQRDERTGWLGDRVMSSYGESFVFDNARLYAKWLQDIADAQLENGSIPDIVPSFWKRYADNVTYPSAFILIPDMLRRQYGDQESFRRFYPAMRKWMAYMWNTYNEQDLVLKDNYGDWCVPPESLDLIWSKDSTRVTEGGLLASAYFYHCSRLMENYARLLHNETDVQYFSGIADRVKSAFNKRYYNPQKQQYANNTITANLLPLSFGMVPENDRAVLFTRIVDKLKTADNHVTTGIIGGMWMMRGLSDNGRTDLALQLATNTTYPSWGYMVGQGATTIWELWNGDAANPMMNSGNHQMLLGDLLVWYYEYLAGIKTDQKLTGFKKVVMRPEFPAGLKQVSAYLDSRYGKIASAWKKQDGQISWTVTIPPNTTAALDIPGNAATIRESGKLIAGQQTFTTSRVSDTVTRVEIGSGTYQFTVANP